MKLAAWRKREGKSQEWVAAQLGCTQPYVSLIEKKRDPAIPNREVMKRIYIMTRREVLPTEWYDIPAWEAELIAAEGDAELEAA